MQIMNAALAIFSSCVLVCISGHRRIIGGVSAKIDDFPWQICFFQNDEFQCGGSIISDRFILTAAHCVYNQTGISSQHIKYGTSTPMNKYSGTSVNVARFHVHPGYTGSDFSNNDVAVLELEAPILFSKSAMPIQLRESEAKGNERVVLSGWGRTYNSESAPVPMVLQTTTSTVFDRTLCWTRIVGWVPWYAGNFVCGLTPGKSGCRGDSGGAVVVGKSQIGIVSSSKTLGCGDAYYPELYTNVAQYKLFIDGVTLNKAHWSWN